MPEASRLPPGLYALCDDTLGLALSPVAQAEALLAGGCRVLQVRFKRTSTHLAVRQVREIAARCGEAGAVCLVNDRVDWCLVAGAHGVHLGAEDLPLPDARRLLGPAAILGATVRNATGARQALAEGADYVGLGPVFGTATKQVEAPVLGLEAFAREVALSPLPVVGIGGITLARIASVAAAGAHGAAVLSDALTASDIPARVRALGEAFLSGAGSRPSAQRHPVNSNHHGAARRPIIGLTPDFSEPGARRFPSTSSSCPMPRRSSAPAGCPSCCRIRTTPRWCRPTWIASRGW